MLLGGDQSRSGNTARRPSPHREELSHAIVVGGERSFFLPRSSWWCKQVKCFVRLREELGMGQAVRGVLTPGSRAAQVNVPLSTALGRPPALSGRRQGTT